MQELGVFVVPVGDVYVSRYDQLAIPLRNLDCHDGGSLGGVTQVILFVVILCQYSGVIHPTRLLDQAGVISR